jgi:hypothetical protein
VRWLKAREAAREWCGGISVKTLYAAHSAGRLKAAKYGAGRNLLFCEQWCDAWLASSAGEPIAPGEERLLREVRRP